MNKHSILIREQQQTYYLQSSILNVYQVMINKITYLPMYNWSKKWIFQDSIMKMYFTVHTQITHQKIFILLIIVLYRHSTVQWYVKSADPGSLPCPSCRVIGFGLLKIKQMWAFLKTKIFFQVEKVGITLHDGKQILL